MAVKMVVWCGLLALIAGFGLPQCACGQVPQPEIIPPVEVLPPEDPLPPETCSMGVSGGEGEIYCRCEALPCDPDARFCVTGTRDFHYACDPGDNGCWPCKSCQEDEVYGPRPAYQTIECTDVGWWPWGEGRCDEAADCRAGNEIITIWEEAPISCSCQLAENIT